MAKAFSYTFEGYTAEHRSTRVYGGGDRYFWHTLTKPDGERFQKFDPWASKGGSHAPTHFYLQTISSAAREDGRLDVAADALKLALKSARNPLDRKWYENMLEDLAQEKPA